MLAKYAAKFSITPEQVEQLAEIGKAVLGDTPSNVISIDALQRGEYPAH